MELEERPPFLELEAVSRGELRAGGDRLRRHHDDLHRAAMDQLVPHAVGEPVVDEAAQVGLVRPLDDAPSTRCGAHRCGRSGRRASGATHLDDAAVRDDVARGQVALREEPRADVAERPAFVVGGDPREVQRRGVLPLARVEVGREAVVMARLR